MSTTRVSNQSTVTTVQRSTKLTRGDAASAACSSAGFCSRTGFGTLAAELAMAAFTSAWVASALVSASLLSSSVTSSLSSFVSFGRY